MSYTEAEQFDLPLPDVPPVQEKAARRQQLIAEMRMVQGRSLYAAKLIGELIEALEE